MTVVFFCPNIIRNAHRSIFGLDRLKEEGFKIILLDASSFYGNTPTPTDPVIVENRIVCSTIEDFQTFRKDLPEEPVLFVTYDNYMKFAAPVLKLIIRKKDFLLSYHTKRFSSVQLPKGKGRLLFNRTVTFLDKYLPLHYLNFFYRKKHELYIPNYFLCSTEFLTPTKVYFTVKRRNRIYVHADDINETMKEGKPIIDPEQKVGVFLDQGLPFIKRTHPLAFKDCDPLPEGYYIQYYKKLEKALWQLKRDLGLDEIVVALHPDAHYFEKELKGKFSGFRRTQGATKDLVRDAQVVFGHYSTAINFAIYYDKPVIILSDEILLNSHPVIRDNMLFFQKDLGMRNFNMDKSDKTSSTETLIDKKKYSEYTRKFLKDNSIKENSYYYAIKKIQEEIERA